ARAIDSDQATETKAIINPIRRVRIRVVGEIRCGALAEGLEGDLGSRLRLKLANAAATPPPAAFTGNVIAVVQKQRRTANAQDVRRDGRPERVTRAVVSGGAH